EEAAASFTRNYDAIAREKPVFQQLYGLFDTVLLGHVLRQLAPDFPLLERLCRLPHDPVEVPRTYAGVRVTLQKTETIEYFVEGAVQVKVAAGRRAWLALDDAHILAVRHPAQLGPGITAAPLPGLTV